MLSSPRHERASSFVHKSRAKSKRTREKKNTLSFALFSLPLVEVEIGVLYIRIVVVTLGDLSYKLHQKVFKPGLVVSLKLL